MKKLLIILFTVSLIGCTASSRVPSTDEFNIPAELQDCKIIKLTDKYGVDYTVFRCPASTTTTHVNTKHPIRSTVIDI